MSLPPNPDRGTFASPGDTDDRPGGVFALPAGSAKADAALVGDDERHLARIADTMRRRVARATADLAAARTSTDVGVGAGVERDLEIRRLERLLRTLSRFGADICLGRMDPVDGRSVYIGRIGLDDGDGDPLLLDWRTPDAAAFFSATRADPSGLRSRRRYRWSRERIVDYWDEVFVDDPAGDGSAAALDSQSAFLRSLSADRSERMQSVLGTIAADQDAAIRADSHGALVVEGGPGTGKTVVALHRAAYLLHADPRLRGGRGSLLIVGPHRPYLSYIADVLPGLGEDGVATCTPHDFVPEGRSALSEADPRVASLKSTVAMVDAVDAAVAFYEEPPADGIEIETPYGGYEVTPDDWLEAFEAVEPAVPHNEAREDVTDVLVDILVERRPAGVAEARLREALGADGDLAAAVRRAWPLLDAGDLVSDLWTVPAYLRRCAPHLTGEQIRLLQRPGPEAKAWTDADLPLLDAARRRLGDPNATRAAAARRRESARRRRAMDQVVDDLIDAGERDDLVSMLRAEDIQGVIVDDAGLVAGDSDALAGPFAHIIVDEAQELTDAQWRMLVSRCPSGSLTVVGDRAQARGGFAESWCERLERIGVRAPRSVTLTVNYRTPDEIMAVAGPVIRDAVRDVVVPTSVRRSGVAVRYGDRAELSSIVDRWVAENPTGTACVIGAPDFAERPRVRSTTASLAKGLEFDLVVLVESAVDSGDSEDDSVAVAVDRYVAMTRSTRELVMLA